MPPVSLCAATKPNCQKFVVLAGWLGSEQSQLKAYKSLYESMGWNVIIKIASPFSLLTRNLQFIDSQNGNNAKQNDCHPDSLQHLSKQLLQELKTMKTKMTGKYVNDEKTTSSSDSTLKAPAHHFEFVWHSFSNGGCFLFETFYPLFEAARQYDCHQEQQKQNNENIIFSHNSNYPQLCGIIFDSSPCYFDGISNLQKAAMANVFGERNQEISEILQYIENGDPHGSKWRAEGKIFWETMKYRKYMKHTSCDRTDPTFTFTTNNQRISLRLNPVSIPEMYIYSLDDPLTPANKLKELIEFRKQYSVVDDNITNRNEKGISCVNKLEMLSDKNGRYIKSLEFSSSQHCAHLKCRPMEYTNALMKFLNDCSHEVSENTPSSKSRL